MRALVPPGGPDRWRAGEPDLHAWYGEDWLAAGGLRVDFVASVDGGITVDGRSAGLQTPGDNRVFAALRDLADVVLVAAGTARAEGYAVVTLSDRRRALRRELGLAEWLPTAVVSRRLDLDPAAGLFAGPGAEHNRTLVVTCAAADPERRAALARVADVVVAGEDDVDLAAARAALEARGLTRILCEGGPSLTAAVVRAGVADELDLSVSPLLVGPERAGIVGGPAWDGPPVPLRLHALLEEDGALFARYRLGPGEPAPRPGTMSSRA